MSINIRETIEEDFEDISALLKDANLRDHYFTRDRLRRMLERNPGLCYVAEDNGKVIGSVFATHDGAFRGHIQKVAVTIGYRRQGIASRLVQTIITKLEEAGIPLIFAHAEKDNLASIDLLHSLGFEIRNSHYLIDRGYKQR